MSELRRFERLYTFVTTFLKLRVVVRKTMTKTRVRGVAHLYRRRPCWIELWLPWPAKPRDYADASAALIHEVGHCALRMIAHTEREAWSWGRRAVPVETVPGTWRTYKRHALGSYEKVRLSDRRDNGAFGRRWEWVKKR